MILSDEFMAELKEKNDIGEIVSSYVELKHKGKNMMGLCPFHSERTPSFCVYPSNGSFYCFGCGAGGDVITFLRLIEHYDYMEAVKKLCERAGMNLSVSEEENDIYKKKIHIYEINREAARFYHGCLINPAVGASALEYLKQRGISKSMITRFGLGYSPPGRYSLVDYLKKKGYNKEDIIMSNLAFKSRNMREVDRFYDRLMFPIIDVRGNVVGFGARTMSNGQPKYINTSDTPVFKKSNNVFALNFASKTAEKNFILAEGYMDVISLHQAGFENSVAALGTALTSSQVKVISRYTDEVVISYDSDEAGKKATQRAIDLLKSNGIKVKIITVPKFKDPDEYLKAQGKNANIKFKNLVETSKNDIEYRLAKIKSVCNTDVPEDKIKYLTESAKVLANCAGAIEREVYALKLSEEIGVGKDSVLIQINKYIKQKRNKEKKENWGNISKLTSAINDSVNKDKRSNLRAAVAEECLIACMINNRSLVNTIFSRVSENMFATEFNKKIFRRVEDVVKEGKEPNMSNIISRGFSFNEIGRIAKINCSYNRSMGSESSVEEYIKVMEEESEKQKLKNNIDNISESEIQSYIKKLSAKQKNK